MLDIMYAAVITHFDSTIQTLTEPYRSTDMQMLLPPLTVDIDYNIRYSFHTTLMYNMAAGVLPTSTRVL